MDEPSFNDRFGEKLKADAAPGLRRNKKLRVLATSFVLIVLAIAVMSLNTWIGS